MPLCVDLDGTLIDTDLLMESALALVSRNPLQGFAVLKWLTGGKAQLKEEIAQRVTMDMSLLPYNEEFLGYLKQEHASGREIVLATATHRLLAEQVAAHLGIFSRVLATENGNNLSGERKRERLVEEFGEKQFDYAANDFVDLSVWSRARKVILVNPASGLEDKVREVAEVAQVFPARRSSLNDYIKALRPHQWAKNMLIFIPALAGHAIADIGTLTNTLIGLISFCLCASSVYVANDLSDLEADRSHAKKRYRPFASGALPIGHGLIMAPLLLAAGFLFAAFLPGWFFVILCGYLFTTVAYTLDIKRRVIVDVLVLAILYTFRLLAGSAATGIDLSTWLLAFSMFFFLSLALVKRYSELAAVSASGDQKARGRAYRVDDLPLVLSLGTTSGYMAVLVLALYVSSNDILAMYRTPAVLWGLCILLLYWVSRTWMLTHRGKMNQDPVVFALTDRISLLVGGLSAVLIFLARLNMEFMMPFK